MTHTTWFIARHGQVDAWGPSRQDPRIVRRDPPLTDEGRCQATALGRRLAGSEAFAGLVFASPFRRTLETAQLICEALDMRFAPLPELGEFMAGTEYNAPFRGMSRAEMIDAYSRITVPGAWPDHWWYPWQENLDAFLARTRKGISIVSRHADVPASLLLVGHGAQLQWLPRILLDEMELELPRGVNTALTRIGFDQARAKLVYGNDTSHLADQPVRAAGDTGR